ncbi:AAA family ATPase [Bacillus niameyensis]|uniref:AAA family ATPase n=1 Tax=Bacillus niameyensis TaxID=1522308 RepID=UPI0007821F03|nr:AAA family ATPase [Bacillus niameyensis]
MESIEFNKPVTIFVGENGTGKSTILEGIAASANLPTAGAMEIANDQDLMHAQTLSGMMRLNWRKRQSRGFFLRAEDFISFVKRIKQMKQDAEKELNLIEIEYKNKSSYAKGLASMPHLRTLEDLKHFYNEGLETRSHGESFLDFFKMRIQPNGLYLIDEPETPLSPMRQLSLISIIMDAIKEGCQFIIITHSPMIMAIPEAEIFSFDHHPPVLIDYEDIEHVQVMESFLASPQSFLRHFT